MVCSMYLSYIWKASGRKPNYIVNCKRKTIINEEDIFQWVLKLGTEKPFGF